MFTRLIQILFCVFLRCTTSYCYRAGVPKVQGSTAVDMRFHKYRFIGKRPSPSVYISSTFVFIVEGQLWQGLYRLHDLFPTWTFLEGLSDPQAVAGSQGVLPNSVPPVSVFEMSILSRFSNFTLHPHHSEVSLKQTVELPPTEPDWGWEFVFLMISHVMLMRLVQDQFQESLLKQHCSNVTKNQLGVMLGVRGWLCC